MGKSAVSMAIINSYIDYIVCLPEGYPAEHHATNWWSKPMGLQALFSRKAHEIYES